MNKKVGKNFTLTGPLTLKVNTHFYYMYMAIWAKMKRRILIGLLNGLNFVVWSIVMYCSQIGFGKWVFKSIVLKIYMYVIFSTGCREKKA